MSLVIGWVVHYTAALLGFLAVMLRPVADQPQHEVRGEHHPQRRREDEVHGRQHLEPREVQADREDGP